MGRKAYQRFILGKFKIRDGIDLLIYDCHFRKEVTNQLENIEDGIGPPDWRLSLCLLSVWSIIFLTVFKGVKSSGKAAYFLALFPYSVLIILLVRGLTLPGSWEGVWYFIKPDWSKILEPSVRKYLPKE